MYYERLLRQKTPGHVPTVWPCHATVPTVWPCHVPISAACGQSYGTPPSIRSVLHTHLALPSRYDTSAWHAASARGPAHIAHQASAAYGTPILPCQLEAEADTIRGDGVPKCFRSETARGSESVIQVCPAPQDTRTRYEDTRIRLIYTGILV